MSVSRMKKLTVFVHRSDTEDLIHRLVRLRCVDVAQAPVTDGRLAVERSNCDEQRTALEKSVSDLGEAITVLSGIPSGQGVCCTRSYRWTPTGTWRTDMPSRHGLP